MPSTSSPACNAARWRPEAWQIVRDNFSRAGGGPAAKTAVTEHVLEHRAAAGKLPIQEFPPGEKQVPATAFGALVAAVGQRDPRFVVTNADGNEARRWRTSTTR